MKTAKRSGMARRDPAELLKQGAAILGVKLYPLGFTFKCSDPVRAGSGGDCATGVFTHGDRQIALWVRHDLGDVRYRKDIVVHPHKALMQYLGLEDRARYPGSQTDDPLDAFRALLADLEHCRCFLEDEGRAFEQGMRDFVYKEPPTGFAALSYYEKRYAPR